MYLQPAILSAVLRTTDEPEDIILSTEEMWTRVCSRLAEPVHISHLKHMGESAEAYVAAVLEHGDSPAMKLGRLIHSVVLGGDYVVYDGERKGNKWKDFEAANEGKEIVTAKEYAKAKRIALAVQNDRDAAPLLVGEKEVRIEWEFVGRACSSRLDVIGANFITDLKTSSNTEPKWFTRHALELGYHAQMWFYREAARYAGHRVDDVYVVSVETEPPFAVTRQQLTERLLEEGGKLCRKWMEELLVCETTREWPSYTQGIIAFDLPPDEERIVLTMHDGSKVAA
jgi:hypothetical protein